jgi:hypothetical protein
MHRALSVVLAASALVAATLGWGFWHASTHTSLNIHIDDYGLRSDNQLYGIPHNASIEFFGNSGESLAKAASVEPLGYILATHPSPEIGNCTAVEKGVGNGTSTQLAYANCFSAHSRWSAQWASKARTATVATGTCVIRAVPVSLTSSTSGWALWWVPLRHVGGVPIGYLEMKLAIDSRTCKAMMQTR